MEIAAGVIVILYIVISIIFTIVCTIATYDRYDKITLVVIPITLVLGPILGSLLVFVFEEKFNEMPKAMKYVNNLLKIEKAIVNEDTYLMTADGKKFPLVGNFRKDIGLLVNKYVKKELDNRW